MDLKENPYRIIKHLAELIDRLGVDISAKVYITSKNGTVHMIYLEDFTFIITNEDQSTFYENVNLLPFLKWVNGNILDIIKIELDINRTDDFLAPIVFYDCDKPGCYYNAKERLKAARLIQKYAIPRYNNPQRPEVKARLLREFNSTRGTRFGQFDNSEALSKINSNANDMTIYLRDNNYFLKKHPSGKYKLTDDDNTMDEIVTYDEFINLIKNKIINAVDINGKTEWIREYAEEKEEYVYSIQKGCLQEPIGLIKEQKNCAICLDKLLDKEVCKPDKCSHFFHCECYNNYKKTLPENSPVPCPLCKRDSYHTRCIKPFGFGNVSEIKYLQSLWKKK